MKCLKFSVICLVSGMLLAASTQAFADKPLKFEVKRLTVDANEGIDVADVDNDGQLDIISGRN